MYSYLFLHIITVAIIRIAFAGNFKNLLFKK